MNMQLPENYRASSAILVLLTFFAFIQLPQTYGADQGKAKVEDLHKLLASFESTKSLAKKETLLYEIQQNYPEAGGELLKIAVRSKDTSTKYKAIFELGQLKYREATPFLVKSLSDPEAYVRANAARALGDMWETDGVEGWREEYPKLSSSLIDLLKRERDGGVIEQTSLALQTLKAKDAVPALKEKLGNSSLGKQTMAWLLQAIGTLGSRQDVPFLASFLDDKQGGMLYGQAAAGAIESITGQDFGLPKHEGPCNPSIGVENARKWWSANRAQF
jgi:HEAT repeat protein